MRHRRSTIWLLLGYLLLLWNVAPSAHHAELLGFHAEGCCHASTCSLDHNSGSDNPFGLNIAGDCGCESHAHHHSQSHESSVVDVDSSCHDCLLCDFFDQFNAMASSADIASQRSPFCFFVATAISVGSLRAINCTARGPPSF